MARTSTARRIVPTATYHVTHEDVIKMLTMRNAIAAMNGKPCPIAARVLSNLEAMGV